MTFQSTVRFDLGVGVVGEIAFAGPRPRVQPGILNTTDPANNVVARAFTYVSRAVDNDNLQAKAGGSPDDGFFGILITPKQYALFGTNAGTLEPTLQLPNGIQGSFITLGNILVDLSNNPTDTRRQIGDEVVYQQTTGILSAIADGGSIPTGFARVPGATVIRSSVDEDPGLAWIQLTN